MLVQKSTDCGRGIKRTRRSVGHDAAINRAPIAFSKIRIARNFEPHANHGVVAEDIGAIRRAETGRLIIRSRGHERSLLNDDIGTGKFDFGLLIAAGHLVELVLHTVLPEVND